MKIELQKLNYIDKKLNKYVECELIKLSRMI